MTDKFDHPGKIFAIFVLKGGCHQDSPEILSCHQVLLVGVVEGVVGLDGDPAQHRQLRLVVLHPCRNSARLETNWSFRVFAAITFRLNFVAFYFEFEIRPNVVRFSPVGWNKV